MNEKEFSTYNFFEQIDKFYQTTKNPVIISTDLLKQVTIFIDLIIEADLKQYNKIDAKKSSIFIDDKNFGLEIFLLDLPENRIIFNYDNNETPLLFFKGKKLEDSLFGQGLIDSCNYLFKYLQSL